MPLETLWGEFEETEEEIGSPEKEKEEDKGLIKDTPEEKEK